MRADGGEAGADDRRAERPADDATFDAADMPRVDEAATEVAGTARALCLDVVELVVVQFRARTEAIVGSVVGWAIAAGALAVGWLASMVAFALWLARWWPADAAVLTVAAVHLAIGFALTLRIRSARLEPRSGGEPADRGDGGRGA
ncbi:MAG: hypothetical protein R3F35_23745 [Myxococcota bacterium]